MATASTITTAEQMLDAGDLGRCEFVRGELKMMSPSKFQRGRLSARVATIVATHVDERTLGVVTGTESGYLLQRHPDTVRAPDVAFAAASRVERAPERGYFPAAPDLAVEVLSPDDAASEVRDWLEAGAAAAWTATRA